MRRQYARMRRQYAWIAIVCFVAFGLLISALANGQTVSCTQRLFPTRTVCTDGAVCWELSPDGLSAKPVICDTSSQTRVSQMDTAYKVLLVGLGGLGGADLGSTFGALSSCNNSCYEANPILAPLVNTPWALGAAKGAGTGAMIWGLGELHMRNKKLSWVVGILVAGGYTAIVVNNVRHNK